MAYEQQPQRPTSVDDREGWKAYWTAQEMPWRTEPEIDETRRRYLAERRAIVPGVEQGIYPFTDLEPKLTRADVEWLLATHESRGKVGPVQWAEEKDKPEDQWRQGLDLRGADLRQVDLSALPLARTQGGLRHVDHALILPERSDLELPETPLATRAEASSGVRLEGAILDEAHFECAELNYAQLAGARLRAAHLEGAQLGAADLQDAALSLAHLEGAFLFGANLQATGQGAAIEAHFEHADLRYANLSNRILVEAHLDDADLRGAAFTDATVLNGAWLGSEMDGVARLADIKWRGANLAQVRWVGVPNAMRQRPHAGKIIRSIPSRSRLLERQRALRASRQLAVALRGQGLNDQADRFSYRAHVLQRRVYRIRRQPVSYFGSLLLDLISGYGYKPMRAFIAYVAVISAFAAAYLVNAQFAAPHLTWDEALVLSISSFHGRGFFTSGVSLGDTLARLAAGEAIIGLLIEITFIATFTQRFFAR